MGGVPGAVGGYRLVRLLGSGGQGSVYLGTDGGAGRVAVKILHEGAAANADAMRRFLREVEVARRVAPFCTARVLDAGVHEGRPYIVSEYVPGDSLEALVRRDGPRAGGGLHRLAVTTSSALAAIHRAGIVHRDFKPANVILGPEGPVVIDFGIARALDQAGTRTAAVGTPAYMAPEQFGQEPVTRAADIFAWAGTIVYAATGHRPFPGDTLPALLHSILNGSPDVSGLPDPLREIVLRCLSKDPLARPTAEELHTLLSGHPPAAVQETRPATVAVEGHPAQHTPVPGAAGAAWAGSAGPEVPTRVSREVVERGGRRRWIPVVAGAAVALVAVALFAWPEGKPSAGPAAAPTFGQPARAPVLGHGNDIRSVAAGTVDGTPVAATGSDDQTVRLWNLTTGEAAGPVLRGHTGWVRSVAFGSLRSAPVVVSASDDDTVRVWNPTDGSTIGVYSGHDGDVKAVATGEYDRRPVVVSAGADASIHIWALEDRKQLVKLTGHEGTVWAAALTELDGAPFVVSAGEDGTVRLWDVRAAVELASLTGHEGPVRALSLTVVNGKPVAVTGGDDGTIRVWDLNARRQDGAPLTGHNGTVWSVSTAVLQDRHIIISGGEDHTARIWDTTTREPLGAPFRGHTDRVWSVTSSDLTGTPLALTASRDTTLRLWSLAR